MRQSMTGSTATKAMRLKIWRKKSASQSENAPRICSISLMTADITRPTGLCWKESDGLLNNLAIHLVPQIRDAGEPDILNQRAAKIFRETL